ncbi:CHAT domain-containing protein [bacterium]|nr:CHAT domain-containing protein [bacterium]
MISWKDFVTVLKKQRAFTLVCSVVIAFAFIGLCLTLVSCQGQQKIIDRSSFLDLKFGLVDSLYNSSRYSELYDACHDVLSDSSIYADPQKRTNLLFKLGKSCYYTGRLKEAKEHYQKALVLSDSLKDLKGSSEILKSLGATCGQLKDYEPALEYSHRCLKLSRKLKNRKLEGVVAINLGRIYSDINEYNKSSRYLKMSLAIFRELNDHLRQINVLMGLAKVESERGNYKLDLEYLAEALNIALRDSLKMDEADILTDMGLCYSSLNNTNKEYDCLNRALSIYQKLNNAQGEIRVLSALVNSYISVGKYNDALQTAKVSLLKIREYGDRNWECRLLLDMGNIHFYLSDFTEAIECFTQCRELCEKLDADEMSARALGNLSTVYTYLNDYEKAEKLILESLRIRREINDQQGIGSALSKLSSIYTQMKKYDKALEYSEESLRFREVSGDQHGACETLWAMADIYNELGDGIKAEESYEQALLLSQKLRDPLRESWATYLIGKLHLSKGDYNEAMKYARMSLKSSKACDFPDDMRKYVLMLEGDCYMKQGNYTEAVQSFTQAVSLLENVRSRIKFESHKRNYVEFVTGLFENIVLSLVELKRNEEAFDYVERGKARAFLDLLSGSVAVEETDIDWTQSTDQENSTENEYDLVSIAVGEPLKLHQAQQYLDKSASLLEYYLTESELLLWIISRDDFKLCRMKLSSDTLIALVNEFAQSLAMLTNQNKLLMELYDRLAGSEIDSLSAENLIIVPHGVLHYLPFQAVMNHNGQYLCELKTISYLPSSSVLQYLKGEEKQEKRNLLALANPQSEDSSLHSLEFAELTCQKMKNIYDSEVLLRDDATETNFIKKAPQYNLLHLACHTKLDGSSPLRSSLLLMPDSINDGRLEVREIFSLKLTADLAILSSCESGLGKLSDGDDLVGLSRAFMSAGVPSIIASLWQVEDESTAFLMSSFYEHLKNNRKADALKLAQQETMMKYKHPFYWSSFIMIGYWN